jgi:hypothetical protein
LGSMQAVVYARRASLVKIISLRLSPSGGKSVESFLLFINIQK